MNGASVAEYAIEKFYTDATDGRGNRDQVRLSLPPSLLALGSILVAKQIIPAYRTVPDILRDAYVHRLHWLDNEFDPRSMTKALALSRTLLDQKSKERERMDQEAVVSNFQKAASDAFRDTEKARALVSDIDDALNNVPLADHLREQLLALRSRFQ